MIVCSTKAIFGILVVLFIEHMLLVSYFQHRSKQSPVNQNMSAQDVISQIEYEQHTPIQKKPATQVTHNIPIIQSAAHQKHFSKTRILPRSEYMKSLGKDGSKQLWPWQTIKVLNLNRKKEKWRDLRAEVKAKLQIDLQEQHRFSAVDGKIVFHGGKNASLYAKHFDHETIHQNRVTVIQELIRGGIISSPCEFNGAIAPGALGNYLTFRQLYTEALKQRYEQILVLEDDVVFHDKIHSLLWRAYAKIENDTSWDIIFLGLSRFKRGDSILRQGEYISLVKGDSLEGAVFGAFAMIMRRRAMEQFLQYGTLPQRVQSDVLLGFLLSGKNPNYPKVLKAYYFHPAPDELVGPDWANHSTETGNELYFDVTLHTKC